MKNILPLPILLLVSLSANAELCSEISNDTQRLSCFDRQSRCAVIEDTQERLICFDNRAHQTTLAPAPTPAEVLAPETTDTTIATQPETEQEKSDDKPAATLEPPPAAPSVKITQATEPAPVSVIEVETSAEIEPTAENETESVTATAEDLEEAFPVRDAPRRQEDNPASVELKASISDVYRDGRSLAIITLDNGQVWREIRKSRFNYRTGLDVTISTGVMGSTNLKADGMKKFVKVKRLK